MTKEKFEMKKGLYPALRIENSTLYPGEVEVYQKMENDGNLGS